MHAGGGTCSVGLHEHEKFYPSRSQMQVASWQLTAQVIRFYVDVGCTSALNCTHARSQAIVRLVGVSEGT